MLKQIALLTGGCVFFMLCVIPARNWDRRSRVLKSLKKGMQSHKRSGVLSIFDTIWSFVGPWLNEDLAKLQIQLRRARINTTPENIRVSQVVAGFCVFTLMVILLRSNIALILLIAPGAGFLAYYLPVYWVNRTAKIRQRVLGKDCLFFADMVTVAIDAGLTVDSAMRRVAHQIGGVIFEELDRAWTIASTGKPKNEAIRQVFNELGVENAIVLMEILLQAERYGSGKIKELLADFSNRLRDETRAKAVEQAQSASLKMLFPILVFIFAPLLVIILGPSFVEFSKYF